MAATTAPVLARPWVFIRNATWRKHHAAVKVLSKELESPNMVVACVGTAAFTRRTSKSVIQSGKKHFKFNHVQPPKKKKHDFSGYNATKSMHFFASTSHRVAGRQPLTSPEATDLAHQPSWLGQSHLQILGHCCGQEFMGLT